jgi:hypothetical protein
MKVKIIEHPSESGNSLALTHLFICPGCKHPMHGFRITGPEPKWSWNGNFDNPTVETRCHLFIRNGKIQFLGDCTHELAGKTVDMVEFDDGRK